MMHSRVKTTKAQRPELEPALSRGSVGLMGVGKEHFETP